MIDRKLDQAIVNHYNRSKSALLLTGARQTGKTEAIRNFARKNGYYLLEINFFSDPNAKKIFDGHRGVEDILLRLSAYAESTLPREKVLIFFDEVQKCPEAVTMIKFLVEDGRYKYALSGSLLGVEMKNVRSVPVGFMDIVEVFPLDFEEFAKAVGVNDMVMEAVEECFKNEVPVDEFVHESMLNLLNLYLMIGGMPAVVQTYIDTKDISAVKAKQLEILEMYKWDISQYDSAGKLYINDIFHLIPSELNAKNKRFIMKNLNEGSRFSKYENGFIWLSSAGAAIPVYNVTAPEFPLILNKQRNLFKLFQNDVGLLACQYSGDIALRILSGEVSLNYGSIYENYVAEELLGHGFKPFFFNSKKQGEIDFVIEFGGSVIPIEVKSGKDYERHNAINNVTGNKTYNIEKAIVLCNGNVKKEGKLLYLPVYMTMFLKRDVQSDTPQIVNPPQLIYVRQ